MKTTTIFSCFSCFLGWMCYLLFSIPSLLAQPLSSKCFEIESILVDACDNPEGANEMVYLRIGPSSINVNDFDIKWPNLGNPWRNFCQNAITANKVATINGTITCPTGKLIEPSGGLLPAGAKVLIISSTDYTEASHSFANLCDTLYVVFQCAGNTAGHFANYNATNPENPRTLEIKQISTNCTDIVAYKPQDLTTKSGNGDGDAAFYEPDGTVSYRNVGCKIPIIPICEIALDSANLKTFCTGQSAKIFFTGRNVPQYQYTWKATDKPDFPFVSPFFVTWNTAGTKTVTLHIDKTPYSATPEVCSVTVDIKPTPQANFSLGAAAACVDGAISVTPQTAGNPPGSSYIWQLGGGIANPGNPSAAPFSISWNTAGTKTLRLRAHAGQCTSALFTQTITVSLRPVATFDVFEKTTCVGQTLKVRANEAGVANAIYNWFLEKDGAPISLNWNGRGLHSMVVNQPGAYTLRFEAQAECQETSTTQSWIVEPTPGFNLLTSNNNEPICAGATLVVSVSALSPSNAQLIWDITNGINPQPMGGNAFSLSWATPGTKTITLRAAANGCTSAVASQVIEVLPLPLATFSSAELPQCAGKTLKVTANSAGIAGSTYAWQVKKDGAIIPLTQTWTGAGPHALDALPHGSYELTFEATTPAGCKAISTPQNWTIAPIPQFTLELPSTPAVACAGQTLTMTVAGLAPPNAQLLWQTTDNVQPLSVGVNIFQATWSTVGIKTLSLRAIANACTSLIITTNIQVTPTPVAQITELFQPPICTGSLLNIKAASTVEQSIYHWQITRNGISIPLNSQWNGPGHYSYVLEEPGNYELTLRVVSPSGCSSNVSQKIWQVNRTPSFQLTPETAFTCNGKIFNFNVLDFSPSTAIKVWNISEGPVPQPINDTTFQISWNTPATRTITLLAIQNGCSLQRSSIVTVYDYPSNNFSLPQGATVCQNDNFTITYPGIAQASWQWNWQITLPSGETRNLPHSAGPHAVPTDIPGIVSVSLTVNNQGCALPAQTQTYLVKPKPKVTLSAPTQACAGASQSLTAQADMPVSHYLWEITDFNSSSFNPQDSVISVTWQNPGVKTISLRAVANGCTSLAAVKEIRIFRTPTAIFSSIPAAICQNSSFSVSHSGIAGSGAEFNWRLTRQEPLPQEEIQTFSGRGPHTVSDLSPGVYRLFLSVTENGCQAAPAEKSFITHPNPHFDFEINKSDYCQAEKIEITVPPAFRQPNLTYHWNLPAGFMPSSISGPGPHTLQTQNIGNFSITGYVSTDKGCTSGWVGHAVKIHRKPQAQILLSRSMVCANNLISVQGLAQPSEFVYNWQFTENLSTPATAGPFELSWGNIGQKTLRLIISSSYCADTAIQTIEVVAPPLPPSSVTVERCGPGTVSFSVTGAGLLTVRLLASNGASILGVRSDPPFILSQQAQTTTTFWLENFNTVAGCGSGRAPAIARILPVPPPLGFSVRQQNCVGDSITLSVNATAPGLRYFWQGPAGLSKETTEPYHKFLAVSSNQSGVYYLRVINSFNCTSSNPIQQQVIVNPLPLTPLVTYYHIFQENQPLCQGNEINLSVLNYPSYEQETRFVWEGPAGFQREPHPFPGIESAELYHTGWYGVRAVARGCTSKSGKVWVTVYPKPLRPQLSNNSPICLGSNSLIELQILAPNDTLHYQWIGPDAFNREGARITREAIASAAGVYKAVAISPQGCISDTGFTQVELIRAPHDLYLVVRGDRCEGGAFILEALPPVPGAIYHWKTPLGENFSTSLNTFSRSGLSLGDNGVYSVSYTVSGCTTPQASVAALVNPQPKRPQIVGATVNCRNQNLDLSIANADSNTEYHWVTGNSRFSGTRLVLRYSEAAALESIQVYGVAKGCTSVLQNIPISWIDRPEPPIILGERTVCLNDTLKLSVFSPLSGWHYTWNGPSSFSATGLAIERRAASVLLGGSYEVVAWANGCSSLPQRVSVEIRNLPEPVTPITNAPICQGETLNLSVSSLNFLPLRWQGPNGFISTQAAPRIENAGPEHSGQYFVSSFDGVCLSPQRAVGALIKPRPEPPILYSNSPICQGEILRLTAIPFPVEADVRWLFRNSDLARGREYVAQNASLQNKGLYQAYSIVNGCTSHNASIEVDIKEKPMPPSGGGSFRFCEGANFRLEVRTQAAMEYYWSAPDGVPAYGPFIERNNASALQNGRYDVAVIQNGCTSVSTAFFVTIKDAPPIPTAAPPPVFCLGDAVILSVRNPNTQAQYIWQGPLSYQRYMGSQILEHPRTIEETGIFSVVQVIEGCTSLPAIVNVIPDLPPGPLLAFSNAPLCQGQTLILMAEAEGATSFLWQGPNNFFSEVRNPVLPNVTTAHMGEYYVWAKRGACSSAIASLTVVVKPQPSPPRVNALSATLCSGETIALNASSQQEGNLFYWTGPSNFQSGISAPRIPQATTAQSGAYTAIAILEGCSSLPASINITVREKPPVPVINSNSPLCQGQTPLRLTASSITIPGVQYQWAGPANFSSPLQNPAITNATTANAGVYQLQVWAQGCTTVSPPLQVQIYTTPSTPKISSNFPCVGRALHLTPSVAPAEGLSYYWTGPNGFTNTLPTPVIEPSGFENSGTYSLVIIQNGCSSREAFHFVEIQRCAKLGQPKDNYVEDFILYPNPAKGAVWVLSQESGAQENFFWQYFIWNSEGKKAKQGLFRLSEAIDLDGLSPGVYQIEFLHGNVRKVLRVMISP